MSDVTPCSVQGKVVFDRAVYDLDTIKKSAYRFIGRFSADIRQSDTEIICDIALSPSSKEQVAELIAELRNEVLDQDLRRTLAMETAPIRNAILALAFAQSNIKTDE